MLPSEPFNDLNLKWWGKREENGVSTPHVLSMRPYAHTTPKHAKKENLVKICHFPSPKVYAQLSNYTHLFRHTQQVK